MWTAKGRGVSLAARQLADAGQGTPRHRLQPTVRGQVLGVTTHSQDTGTVSRVLARLIYECATQQDLARDREIDHVNRDWRDNRIANLRTVTRGENAQNTCMHRDNRTGIKGIQRFQAGNCVRYYATLTVAGKRHVGTARKTKEEAAVDRAELVRQHHPFAPVPG